MKAALYLSIALLFSLTAFGQADTLARLSIYGSVSEIGISPSEEIWLATRAGKVYHTRSIGELWHSKAIENPYGSTENSGEVFERINIFGQDTLMISGFIGHNGKQNFVYWSGDHGTNWEKTIFGQSSWIDAVHISDDGKAWMSGSSQLIYYTENRGKTWTSFNKVEQKGNLRFSSIYFGKDNRTGLFGSGWNVLYRTTDNCQSWQKLPTPLTQGKYLKLSKNERPEVEKIRIAGHYYIVNQQGKVFVSRSDTINWVYQPQIMDFEVSDHKELYTVNRDHTISLYNDDFVRIWQSEKGLDSRPLAIGVKNKKLFALTPDCIYRIGPGEFFTSELRTDDVPIPEPDLTLRYKGEKYGFTNKDVLRFDKVHKRWQRMTTLKFGISSVCLFNNNVILANQSTNKHFIIDLQQLSVREYVLPNSLFSGLSVKKLQFEELNYGCFHSESHSKTYVKRNNKFIADGSSRYLKGMSNVIENKQVMQLINTLEGAKQSRPSFGQLNITPRDIEKFQRFINTEEQRLKKSVAPEIFSDGNLYNFPGENCDFNFYRSVADSLGLVSEAAIDDAFWQSSGNLSTSTICRRLTIVFENGKKLIVENSDDSPNYLGTPWILNFDGLVFRTNSLLLGQHIDKITNGEFLSKVIRDKNYAIFKIADYMYRKKINSF